MILLGIGVVMSFLQLFTVKYATGIPSAIVGVIISAYFFICVYSLYDKLKAEKTQLPEAAQMHISA